MKALEKLLSVHKKGWILEQIIVNKGVVDFVKLPGFCVDGVVHYLEASEGQPDFDFVTKVPVTWDETKANGDDAPGFQVMAQRKKTDWHFATISDLPQEIKLQFDFFQRRKFETKKYTDVAGMLNNRNIEKSN